MSLSYCCRCCSLLLLFVFCVCFFRLLLLVLLSFLLFFAGTFHHLFSDHPSARYALVVEDDMVFAPDFMSYFVQLAPLYDADPSIYCITSWNDNAQRGLALDPRALYRTDFFIGLGWLISRAIFSELEPRWPPTHWDHWFRAPAQRKGRQTIYPEIARNFNIGKRGTHSDDAFYQRYFEQIQVNQQHAVWLGDVNRMQSQAYDARIYADLKSAIQISALPSLRQYSYANLVLFLSLPLTEETKWEKVYAPYFGLFHSVPAIRGMYHETVLKTRWRTNYLTIVRVGGIGGTVNQKAVGKFKKEETRVMGESDFVIPFSELQIYRSQWPAAESGGSSAETCSQVCRRRSLDQSHPELACSPSGMSRLNSCDILQQHFHCKTCEVSEGVDQPAWVHSKSLENKGFCLVNSKEPTCEGAHKDTLRLCACVERP